MNTQYDTKLVLEALARFGLFDWSTKQPKGVMLFYANGKGSSGNTQSLKPIIERLKGGEPTNVYVVPAYVKQFNVVDGALKRRTEDLADADYIALVAEHDDVTQDESMRIVAESGLPTPTFQIDSGGKSVHHWWLLKEPITQAQFVEAQTRLAKLLNSDTKVALPTQVFRLPGFTHAKGGRMCDFLTADLDLFDDPVRHAYEDLEALLPALEEPTPAAAPESQPEAQPKRAKKNEWFTLLSPAAQDDAAADMLGHVWAATSGDHPDSHETRRQVVAGLVGFYRSPAKVQDIWKEAQQRHHVRWDKTTKANMLQWASELIQGQESREKKHHPAKNDIGTVIRVATQFGWSSSRYKRMLAENADHLQKLVCNELFDDGEGWITYRGKCYKKISTHYEYQDDVELCSQITAYLSSTEDYASKSNATNVKGALEWLKLKTGTTTRPNPDGYINCINGVLEVKAGGHRRLIPHQDPESEKYVFFDAPKFVYDPNADRTQAERLLECLPDPRARALFLRTMAFAINWEDAARGKHGHSIAIFSKGEGSNGKDTNIVMLRRIFGTSAVTGVTLSEFSKADKSQSYVLSELATARLNLPSETSCQLKIDHLKSLKAVTTGDEIWAEAKHVQGTWIKPKLSQMYPTNNEFLINNTREADERRYMCLEWPYSFVTKQELVNMMPDKYKMGDRRFLGRGVDDEWVCKHVVPGYFNILLDYFEEVCIKGFDDLRDYSKAILETMGKDKNHVRKFVDEIGLICDSGLPAYHEDTITLNKLFEEYYKPWCRENGRSKSDRADGMFDEIELAQVSSGDKTCMTASDLKDRLLDLKISVDRPNQRVASTYGIERKASLKHCKLIPVEQD